ncbi:hypothetical protein [Longirhabdus pacifica]|uniref:hypothetical protein n=1 Tax=Longirhabdus pacifica TaxID=2305227 RepID=UPI0013E8EACA|nr:hypothetical protein [Longirhabdus pacifica]
MHNHTTIKQWVQHRIHRHTQKRTLTKIYENQIQLKRLERERSRTLIYYRL